MPDSNTPDSALRTSHSALDNSALRTPHSAIKLSVVTPTYNEAENIGTLISRISETLKDIPHEIIVSDDDSPDETWKIAEDISKENPNVRCLRRMENRGLYPAVLDAFEIANGKYLAVIDADLQHDETKLPDMLEEIENNGHGIVIGTRYAEGGGTEGWSGTRLFISKAANFAAGMLMKRRCSDMMSGFFMVEQETYKQIKDKLNPRGFKILMDIIQTLPKDKAIGQVPYIFKPREQGTSKLDKKVMFDFLVSLYELSIIGKYIPLKFLKFCLVGLSGVGVNWLILFLGKNYTAIDIRIVIVSAILVSMLSNFMLNNIWTFAKEATHKPVLVKCIQFFLICGIGAGIIYVITYSLYKIDFLIYFASFLGIAAATVWNYVLNSLITWRDEKKTCLNT